MIKFVSDFQQIGGLFWSSGFLYGATVWSILTLPGLDQNSDNTDEIRPEIQNITFLRSSNLNDIDIRTITLHVDGI